MTIINTSPDRIIQLGYEGEDRVTVLRFRYGADWLENGEGIFHIRVRRHGEHTAYNAALVADDTENNCLLMTVTNTELSVKGSGEMQVVYSGSDFVKKSPIYSYNVSRAVDDAVDPPAQDVYTQIIESLSDLQTGMQGKADVQTVSALSDAVNDLDSDVQGLQTSKADTQTVTALSDTVSGLQTAVQGKADAQTVTALSGTVSSLSDTTQQYMEQTESTLSDLQNYKADLSYVNDELADKADVQTVTTLSGTVTDLQTNKADKTYVDAELAGKASTAVATNSYPNVEAEAASVVSITDGADGIPVKSLVVGIEPVQDLHGYDHPWPGGGTKNKMPPALAKTETINGVVFTSDGNGTYTAKGTASANTICYFELSESFTILDGPDDARPKLALRNTQASNDILFQFFNGNTQIDSWGCNPLNRFAAYSGMRGKSCNKYAVFVQSGVEADIKIQPMLVENSATDSSFIPFENLCPITGWTGCNVFKTGVNLWDEEWEVGSINSSGDNILNSTTIRTKNYIPVAAGTTYYYKSTETAGFRFYDANKTFLSSTIGTKNATFVVPSGAYYLRFAVLSGYGTTYNDDICISYPSTNHDYSSGTDNATISITFPSEAGTVYGGSLDVTNGALTVDKAMVDLGTLTWSLTSDNSWGANVDGMKAEGSMLENSICEYYPIVSNGYNAAHANEDKVLWQYNGSNAIRVRDSAFSEITQITTGLSGHYLCYTLATPITYQLTPTEIKTLLGANNVWADTGDVQEMIYRADTKLYVEGVRADHSSMIAPVEKAYTATRNYTTGQLLIVDNALYKVTANIANGGTITVGTNVVATTLSEVILALA